MSSMRHRLGLAGLLVSACAAIPGAQTRDAAAILRDMRTALGGDAALDAIQTLSVAGSVTETIGRIRKGLSLDWFVLLPDHFMIRRRDSQLAGPMPVDITYFRGFKGDSLIRRTDANIQFPVDPGPQTPEAIAQRERDGLVGNKQEFARFSTVLFGKSFDSYPLQFSYVGPDTADGRPAEVMEGRSADGFVMRLYVDATTHLPTLIAWQGPQPIVMTTSSTVVMRGNEVVSRSPPSPLVPNDSTTGLPMVTWRLSVSDFKVADGLNWPHRFRLMLGAQVTEDTRLGKFKINPKFDARKFDVGR